MKWRECVLADLVYFQRGFDITQAAQVEGPYPVISSSGVTSYHNEYMVEGPGIVIGRKGTLGSVHFAPGPYWPHDTTLWSKRLNGNDPRFVLHFMRNLDLKRFNVGNANPTLNRNHIHDLKIRIPDLPTQRRIAEILSAYDDLIENNQRRMKLLEESARMLYQEWFVRLHFPGYEHTKIVDGVPEGWRMTSIEKVTPFLGRGISPTYNDVGESMVINQKCIRNRRLDLSPARRQSKVFKPDRQIQVGDVLVNSTGEGTLGRVSQVFVPIPNCTVDSHVTIVRPSPEISRFVFGQMMMLLDSVFPAMGRGATNQKELGRDQIGEMMFLLPPRKISKEFDTLVEPLYLSVHRLQEQNQKLRAARDLLLPRLMNGEIEV